MNRYTHKQHGFTVLELMVAMSVFTVVLLVLTVGILRFSQDYFRGVTRSRTQTVARQIIDDIAQNIQFGQTVTPNQSGSGYQAVCIDSTRYQYKIGQQVAPADDAYNHRTQFGFIKTVGTNCVSSQPSAIVAPLDSTTQHEMLGNNMRLLRLAVNAGTNNTWTVSVTVAYGDDDLLNIAPGASLTDGDYASLGCVAGAAGSQFCAVSTLTTTVQQRITK